MNDSRSETGLLKHYRLQDPFPDTWSDPIEEAQLQQRKLSRRSTKRYSVLQDDGVSSSLRGLVGGGDVYSGTTVAQDEPDPLGTADSVVRVLKKRGIPAEENVRLRNRYLVSSKTFAPTAFLRDVHATTPAPALQQGLNYLSGSIAQKSGSLKVLVETNFDRFVAAKATIEGVYKEMKENSFLEKDKESEYGVGKIRTHLTEAGAKADDVFGPVMKGRGREETLRVLLAVIAKHKEMLEIPGVLLEAVKRKDYEAIIETYKKAIKSLADARALAPNSQAGNLAGMREEDIHQLIIAEKMWTEATIVLDDFRRDTWKRLMECRTEDNTHMEFIGILLEVGVDDNPISMWLQSRCDYLKTKITTIFERTRIEVEVTRRKVLQAPIASLESIANHLRNPTRRIGPDAQKSFDTPLINSFWELLLASITAILDPNAGILGEILNFWKTAQSFIDGDNLLPVGIDDLSMRHHRLSEDEVRTLRRGTVDLVNQIRESMATFFQDPPLEDLPTPNSAVSPVDGQFSSTDIPPVPKMQGQAEDEGSYAFFPPGANSLGGAHYLGKIMVLLGSASAAMVEMGSAAGASKLEEKMRSTISAARERTVTALSTAWIRDAQNCKVMEDWTRAGENRGVTKMPGCFLAFEKEIVSGLQGIIYLDKVRTNESGIIPPPSVKLLSNIRGQFVRSLYTAISGMVENAKKPVNLEEMENVRNGLASPVASVTPKSLDAYSVDSEDKNVRMLLTLSNLQLLRAEVVPELISLFETSFSVKLIDESKTIRDALGQIDAQLFQEYTKPIVRSLADIAKTGILSPSWSPPPGKLATEVRPYIYQDLLLLVDVHAQITTTAPVLVQQVLSYLLEELSRELLEGFKQRKKFTLGELLQATLDVEFVNQTLSQFGTPKASEWQQKVYVELDRGSDAEARQGLQKELGEMKTILTRLRKDSRAEFLCFRAKKSSSRRTNTQTSVQA